MIPETWIFLPPVVLASPLHLFSQQSVYTFTFEILTKDWNSIATSKHNSQFKESFADLKLSHELPFYEDHATKFNRPIDMEHRTLPYPSPPSAAARQLSNSPPQLSPSPTSTAANRLCSSESRTRQSSSPSTTSAVGRHLRKSSSNFDNSNSLVESNERSHNATPNHVISVPHSDKSTRRSGSMVSNFLDEFHTSPKIICTRNLSYSDDENGCAIWIEGMKHIPEWEKWVKKYKDNEKQLVETKKKEFARCNQFLRAFILDAEPNMNYNGTSKEIMTALFSTYYPF